MFSSEEHLRLLKERYKLTEEEATVLLPSGGLNVESANRMIENVVGIASRPLAIIPGLIVNGKEYSVPLVTEQSSIIPMVEKGVALSGQSGGFTAENTGSVMIARATWCM